MHVLYHIDTNKNLLNEKNLKALFKFIPHAKSVLAALRAIINRFSLPQTLFDEIVANPKEALCIAYKMGGIPFVDDSAVINRFIEIRKAARVLSQSMRSQYSVFFTLPNELLTAICTHLTNTTDLDEATAHTVAYLSLQRPD